MKFISEFRLINIPYFQETCSEKSRLVVRESIGALIKISPRFSASSLGETMEPYGANGLMQFVSKLIIYPGAVLILVQEMFY